MGKASEKAMDRLYKMTLFLLQTCTIEDTTATYSSDHMFLGFEKMNSIITLMMLLAPKAHCRPQVRTSAIQVTPITKNIFITAFILFKVLNIQVHFLFMGIMFSKDCTSGH